MLSLKEETTLLIRTVRGVFGYHSLTCVPQIDLSDVSDPVSQRKLFSSLLDKSQCSAELSTLCSLLDCWSELG